MLLVCLAFISAVEKSAADLPLILDGQGDPATASFIYFSSTDGLCIFDRVRQTWSRINQNNGLPDNRIILAGLDEGILWVSTPAGLASADVRLNDWQIYDLPGSAEGLGFDEHFVWVGGDFGLRRYDKYAEVWETINPRPVNDLWVEKNQVWLATDSGVFCYDPHYQRLEAVPAAGRFRYHRIIATTGRLWFCGDDQMVAYRMATGTWSGYGARPVTGVSNLGDSLYAVSGGKIMFYEPTADQWLDFRDGDRLTDAVAVRASAGNLFCATNHGLVIYDLNSHAVRTYNRGHGLTADSLTGVYTAGPWFFVLSRQGIDVQDTAAGIWQQVPLPGPGGRSARFLYLNEDGGHARLHRGFDLKLQGRAFLAYQGRPAELLRSSSINAKLIGQHQSGRIGSMYYEDANKDDTLYGFGYRGKDEDLLYRLEAGFLESEYADLDLLPGIYHRGGQVKIRSGPVQTGLQLGQERSVVNNDFFTGRTSHKSAAILDINDARYCFYNIDSISRPFRCGVDTLFVDDRNTLTDNEATRHGFTAAGLTGDFDPLLNGRDYFINYEEGLVNLLTPASPDAWLVLVIDGQGYVLQSDSIRSRMVRRVYGLGVSIIPATFSLTIEDTAGQRVPLSIMGVDHNQDGHVDPEYINYDRGWLRFPASAPISDSIHVYTLHAEYESYTTFYFLSLVPIHPGSERVYVDGQLMTRAVDYLLDYTSGVLIFLNESAVSEFSEIQVQYAHRQRPGSTVFFNGQPVINLNDHLAVAPGFTRSDNRDLIHLSGHYQSSADNEAFALRYVPQLIMDERQEWAQRHTLTGQYQGVGYGADYQSYSAGFDGMGVNLTRTGHLRQRGSLSSRIELLHNLFIDGRLGFFSQIDTQATSGSGSNLNAGLSYLNPRSLQGRVTFGRDHQPDLDRDRLALAAWYETMFQTTQLKISGSGHLDQLHLAAGPDGRDRGLQMKLNGGWSRIAVFDGAGQFNELMENDNRTQREEEWRGAVTFDAVPGVSYRINYRQRRRELYYHSNQDLFLNNNLFNNLTIAPGVWLPVLTAVNFLLGSGVFFDQYLEEAGQLKPPPVILIRPVRIGTISQVNQTNSYFGALQLNPRADCAVWLRRTVNAAGLSYYEPPTLPSVYLDELQLELEPRTLGLWRIYAARQTEAGLPEKKTWTIFCEWNRPWSAFLRTVWSVSRRDQQRDFGTVQSGDQEIKSILKAIVYVRKNSYVTGTAGVRRQVNPDHTTVHAFLPSAGLNFNLWQFLFLQFDYDGQIVIDQPAAHRVNLKISGQL